jgi:hypothetical protein
MIASNRPIKVYSQAGIEGRGNVSDGVMNILLAGAADRYTSPVTGRVARPAEITICFLRRYRN